VWNSAEDVQKFAQLKRFHISVIIEAISELGLLNGFPRSLKTAVKQA